MKFLVAATLALALGGWSTAANAQGAPQGSYRGKCANIRMDGTTLKAVCTTKAGGRVLTELHDAERCGDIVVGDNGLLQCLAQARPEPPGPGYRQGPPPGYGQAPPPGSGGPGPGYGERREGGWEEHCERLRHRARELRERLRYDLPPHERREAERRLGETREEFNRDRCREWRD